MEFRALGTERPGLVVAFGSKDARGIQVLAGSSGRVL